MASGNQTTRSRASKTKVANEHYAIVFQAAQTVVSIFRTHNINCAVFGSLACKLYGSGRCPKDVDLLVLEEGDEAARRTAHQLKQLILRANSRNFFLKMPRDPQAEYRILYFRQYHLGPECKVDILTPGIMNLPIVAPQKIVWVLEIPLVPFSLLLLHKLQGWHDHHIAEEKHKNHKQQQDAGDLRRMMAFRGHIDALCKASEPWGDEELFSDEFLRVTRERVETYCKAFPGRVEDWIQLGFEVEVPPPPPAVPLLTTSSI